MAQHQGKAKPPITVSSRITLLRDGMRSAVKRYSADLLHGRPGALHPRIVAAAQPRQPGETVKHFAEEWEALPSAPGLSGVAWLGHCSVLLKLGGKTILTDPVLSHKIGVKVGPIMVGPRRLAPTIPAEALPPVDLIVISHAHFDHLDKPTLRALVSKRTVVVTSSKTGHLIPRGFDDVLELEWFSELTVGGLHLRTLRPAHWGARNAWDRHRGYNSYIFSGRAAGESGLAAGAAGGAGAQQDRAGASAPYPECRVLFAGDTAYTEAYRDAGPIDLAVFGIGAYNPWEHAHATPEQALAMATQAGAKMLLPVHHSTFKLSDEPPHEPMTRLQSAAKSAREARGETPRIIEAAVGDIVGFGK
ncbi:hypothetical protein BH11PLA1_BH11PLA1_20070 [soil metagenome]